MGWARRPATSNSNGSRSTALRSRWRGRRPRRPGSSCRRVGRRSGSFWWRSTRGRRLGHGHHHPVRQDRKRSRSPDATGRRGRRPNRSCRPPDHPERRSQRAPRPDQLPVDPDRWGAVRLAIEDQYIFSFVPETPGLYRFALVVGHDGDVSLPDFVDVTVKGSDLVSSQPAESGAATASRTRLMAAVAHSGLASIDGGPALARSSSRRSNRSPIAPRCTGHSRSSIARCRTARLIDPARRRCGGGRGSTDSSPR